ncbi:homeobox-leucine zipper protein HAT22-like [Phoenix dactylifera]|uniref:Homeobox-leucine zipper protein HAT22-like n=1 Tax=Phoenix dactylifera TaxID=42345 RepID=A0A8B8J4V9_PHODC|nr:homeobox-leucine zipper protein HAT22-like [Phoenix dactylifera]
MEEDECNIGLGLAIGAGRHFTSNQSGNGERKPPVQFHILFPPRPKEGEEEEEEEPTRDKERHKSKHINEEEDSSTKDIISDGGSNRVGMRKKLRLTKEQLTFLENSFREHNTLNQTQKQQLAYQLNLRPRQVEVWFQNRRARTKLKQTEVDCAFLKKYCENLRNENRRLKRELEELRAMEPGYPFHTRVPKAATPTMCPSCKRIMASGSEKGNSALDARKGRGQLKPVNNGLVSL